MKFKQEVTLHYPQPHEQIESQYQQAPRGQRDPSPKDTIEREHKPQQKKAYTLTKDELEVRGMLARGIRPTDIMKAKFGADTYVPEKVRLRALSQVTTMIRHLA